MGWILFLESFGFPPREAAGSGGRSSTRLREEDPRRLQPGLLDQARAPNPLELLTQLLHACSMPLDGRGQVVDRGLLVGQRRLRRLIVAGGDGSHALDL